MDALQEGHAAFDRAEWEAAAGHYRRALEQEETPEALEGLSRALYWSGAPDESHELRLRAFEAYRRRGQAERAANLACYIAGQYRVAGNASLARGWLGRAERLAAEAGQEGEGHVWLEVERAKRAAGEEAEPHARAALAVARRLGDPALEATALSHLGRALVDQERLDEGLAVLDEAMATAFGCASGDPLAIGDACCTTLVTCDGLADPGRARDWAQAIVDFTRRRRYTPLTPWCGSIYAGFLVLTGRWQEAEAELQRALAEADRATVTGRATATATLADLRLRQGRVEEAAALLSACAGHPAALHAMVRLDLARDEPRLALERLDRAAADDPLLRAEALIAAGDPAGRAWAETLTGSARDDVAAMATVLLARAGAPDADALERAVGALDELEMPFEAGRARMELARALGHRHPALAAEHARAALLSFDELGAGRHADQAAALLRELGAPGRPAPRSRDVLTRREQEVLDLVAAGLSNGEIAGRLVISPRTAEHHVGRVLRKLGLRNRAEAAVYAARRSA